MRYVDDTHIFCRSRLEAKAALRRLIELLHRRGLNVQSAKTKILTRAEAQPLIDGITPTIEQIHRQLIDEIEIEFQDAGPYIGPSKLAILLGESEGTPVEVIERSFSESFLSATTWLIVWLLLSLESLLSTVSMHSALALRRRRLLYGTSPK